jgi:hypothetical protein
VATAALVSLILFRLVHLKTTLVAVVAVAPLTLLAATVLLAAVTVMAIMALVRLGQ